MEMDNYQKLAATTAIYPPKHAVIYPALGLFSEAGEVAGKIKKHLRDGTPIDIEALAAEIGDVLWYVAVLAADLDINLSEIAERNLAKLKSRQVRGVLGGSGDNR